MAQSSTFSRLSLRPPRKRPAMPRVTPRITHAQSVRSTCPPARSTARTTKNELHSRATSPKRTHNLPTSPARGSGTGIPWPGEQVSTHFSRALADILAGIERKIECAQNAPIPQSSDFSWAGPGRGPPRSDPEIFKAGLEVWAAPWRGRRAVRGV